MIPYEMELRRKYSSLYYIPEALKAYDGKLFVTWEWENDVPYYVIWRENGDRFPLYIMKFRYDEFDSRVLEKIRQCDAWNRAAFIREMDERNEKLQKSAEKYANDELEYRMRSSAKYIWEEKYDLK